MADKLEQVSVGGAVFWVEVAELDTPGAGGTKTNTSNKSAGLAQQITGTDLEKLVGALVAPVKGALASVANIKECSVELSLGLKAEVGFFVAKGETNAALKISVKW